MNQTLTFAESLGCSRELLEAMRSGDLKAERLVSAVSTLIATENGARGFFVTYLTDDVYGMADRVTPEIVEALKNSPELVSDLLVKNIAMSTAMELTHLRNNDEDMAGGSRRVQARTMNLISLLKLEEINDKLQQLRQTLKDDGGIYQDFLERWGYDEEQKAVIATKIDPLINNL
ncbi:MAG: hypothetical protein N5P05_003393 [Chroococcopsis gigantea SAG 12.99]|jgi:hypothetical protein|nr:hypothetical protein [Chlorogloea purpurea SAG 13.99]MDV3001787.1 hypothetical protein [Chroococcopsis gigantea SAG 12.99]